MPGASSGTARSNGERSSGRRSNGDSRRRGDRGMSRLVLGTDDEEDPGEHHDEPGAEDHEPGGAQPVKLAEQQGSPNERRDYVQGSPRPARPCQADVLRGPKCGVVAGGPYDPARKRQPEGLPPEREMTTTDDQRDRGENRVTERRVEGPRALRDTRHNLSDRYPEPPGQHRRQREQDSHGRRTGGWLRSSSMLGIPVRAAMSSLVAAGPITWQLAMSSPFSEPVPAPGGLSEPLGRPGRGCRHAWPGARCLGCVKDLSHRGRPGRRARPCRAARTAGPLCDPHRAKRLR